MKVNRNTTLTSYLFGDFDRDGVKNADDPYPFNRSKSKWPNGLSYYQRSRFGGGEVLLTEALKKTQDFNNHNIPLYKTLLRNNPGSYGRVKSVPSTIRKLVNKEWAEKRPKSMRIFDSVGLTIPLIRRKEVYKKAKDLVARRGDGYSRIIERENHYSNLVRGKGAYGAYHLIVGDSRGRRAEIQVKTKKFADLTNEMHPYYKAGKIPDRFKTRALALFRKGY
jgi:ppGpp synthetase/RelA/SpoT-type nucleotidyltranferase